MIGKSKHERRSDIVSMTVQFEDGTERYYSEEDVRVGAFIQSINMDADGTKDRQEWDTIEVHLSGPKRPVRRD